MRYTDDPGIVELSRAVFKFEDPSFTSIDYMTFEPPPLVLELLEATGRDGIRGALGYLMEAPGWDVPVLLRWMKDGAFKGVYESDAAFCRDHFAGVDNQGPLMQHLRTWDGSGEGFSLWPSLSPGTMGDLFDWTEFARLTVNRDGAAFHSIEWMQATYVFDVSISTDHYQDKGWGECRWDARCGRQARTRVMHRISGPLPACQPCADQAFNSGSC